MVLLASCVGPPSRSPAPARPAPRPVQPAPAAPPAATPAPPAANWEDRALTPGDWRYMQEGQGSVAVFAAAGQPLFTLRCDRATRRISALRAGVGQGGMVIRTSYGAVNWPAASDGSGRMIAARSATDSVLDQMAYSRGKIGVEMQGLAPLILPAWAEVARVIEDCRG